MKLLIVDDELHIRRGLQSAVDWLSLGISEVFTAENGVAALEICKREYPEIIITDIKMPGISGIELAEKITDLYEVNKIILLSGYSEFEYAKAAIKIGVVDYLLKPVKIAELSSLVASTTTLIEKEKIHQKSVQRKLLGEVISGEALSKKSLYQGLTSLGIATNFSLVCGVVAEDILYENYTLAQKGSAEARLAFAASLLESENIRVINNGSELIFLLYLKDASLRRNYRHNLAKKLSEINDEYKTEFGLSFSAGISQIGSAADVVKLYEQGTKALATRLYSGTATTAFYEKQIQQQRFQPLVNIDEKDFVQQISMFQTDKVLETIGAQFEFLSKNKCTSYRVINELIIGIKSIMFSTIADKGIDIVKIIETNAALFDIQINFTTLESYSGWLKDLCQLLMMGLGDLDKKRYSNEMIKVIEYINQNYAGEISLDLAAQQANKSSNYFSYIFKREMQVNFSEYLNQRRIEKAKELLAFSDKLVYQVAEEVGFKDYAYFTKVFKKICGVSPTEYRENK